MKVLFLPAARDDKARIIEIGGTNADMQALVGGYLEHIRTGTLQFKSNALLCDEEGRLKGKPTNFKAINQSGYAGIICGDCIIVGEKWAADPEDGMIFVDYHE